MAKKKQSINPPTKQLPSKSADIRHPHKHDAPEGEMPITVSPTHGAGQLCQTWDDDLAERLEKLGNAYHIDKYDPVVAMAEMAMDVTLDDKLRFNCHKEVAKFVRLKRQIEPTINIQQNVYELPAPQRRARIEELTQMIADSRKVIEHDG